MNEPGNVLNRTLSLRRGDALVIMDVQNDYLPGGALAMPHGDVVIPVLNHYVALFELQDIRERTKAGLMRLPGALRRLESASDYPVAIAPSVQELARIFDEEHEYAHPYEHK